MKFKFGLNNISLNYLGNFKFCSFPNLMEFKLKISYVYCKGLFNIKQKTYSPKIPEEPGEWLLDSPIPKARGMKLAGELSSLFLFTNQRNFMYFFFFCKFGTQLLARKVKVDKFEKRTGFS